MSGSGIVKHQGYKGESTRGKGMRNKRKAKKARIKREAEMAKMRKQREKEAREEEWLAEWGDLSGSGDY